MIDSPHAPEMELQISATTTGNIDTPMESLVEEQQQLVQSPNSPHSHPVRQQQLQHHSGSKDHSEEHVGDKKRSTNEVRMDVLGDQQDHNERNIVVPLEKTKALSKQKKTKKTKKKMPIVPLPPPPIPREPPLFARKDAGHVVYRGGEIISMEGVYCV
jgi:ribonuclease P protein subunit RPR2